MRKLSFSRSRRNSNVLKNVVGITCISQKLFPVIDELESMQMTYAMMLTALWRLSSDFERSRRCSKDRLRKIRCLSVYPTFVSHYTIAKSLVHVLAIPRNTDLLAVLSADERGLDSPTANGVNGVMLPPFMHPSWALSMYLHR